MIELSSKDMVVKEEMIHQAQPLRIGDHGATYQRDMTCDMALAQIGWVGSSGYVYPLACGPNSSEEPGGFAPLLIQVGTWEDLGDGHWGIRD